MGLNGRWQKLVSVMNFTAYMVDGPVFVLALGVWHDNMTQKCSLEVKF